MAIALKRLDDYRIAIERTADMRVPATIYSSDRLPLEDSAVAQLRDAASLAPARKVLATPDIHHGYGVPIGSVLALEAAVMPAAVGYDINCGMRLLSTPLMAKDCDPSAIAHSIARDVPLGEGKSNLPVTDSQLDAVLTAGLAAIETLADSPGHRTWEGHDPDELSADIKKVERSGRLPGRLEGFPGNARQKGANQLGTLGGGNHFIEIQRLDRIIDETLARRFGLQLGQISVMIHSGSRRIGYQVADEYIRRAAEETGAQGPQRQLAYLSDRSKNFELYIGAMHAAGNFAYVNRHIMTLLVRRCFGRMFGSDIEMPLIYDVSHNMAQLERHDGRDFWVHRKGATRAFGPGRMKDSEFADIGQPVIIPGSMGTSSYLLVGSDGSEETLCSVNHGAGRTMSRTAASGKSPRRRGKPTRPAAISDEQFRRSMSGITLIAADRSSVKEEAPDAYKNIDDVIEVVCGAGLAKAVARFRPLAVLKG